MTTITITLPDDLAKQAEEKGLLSQTAIESYVRDKLKPSPRDKLAILESLCGIVPPTASLEEARIERFAKYEI